MKSEAVQGFKGKINGVEFDDENIFCSSEEILEHIEEKFGECYTDGFVKDLRDTVETIYQVYKKFSFNGLREDFGESIEKAEKFNGIKFLYEGGDWLIESLNKKIAEDAFEKKGSLKR